jgi:hypothetical protein
MFEHAPHELTDERIADRYTVVRLIGRGGTADVYEVRDPQSGRALALKRLHTERPERMQLALALFEREYYTLAQLAHPSVIRVYEYGVDERGAHYTMELLDGSDLFELGKRPWQKACSVLRDVASALAMLHSRRWLHRDLSPRNVILQPGGLAKLIDFGAMVPMGVAKALVGTPPLVPPEAVQQQSLDAQSDLYSLGALAYFMLTGRHAYAARSFDELRDLWRSAVRPPKQLAPDVPEALSRLVMELIHLDRFARPASAAAVIERLDGLLGRDGAPAAEPEAGRAYLATPKLIARDHELSRVRERMVHSLAGRGVTVLVHGEPGSGRSRFLDACVLEARLLGATVLRADATDAGRGEYGVIAALGEQLIQAAPKLAADVARLHRVVLERVLPSMAEPVVLSGEPSAAEPSAAEPAERRQVQTALRDFFRAIARSKRIVIAVDDVERIDEPSLAVLAALAHKSERRRLVLIAATRSAAPTSAGLELLRDAALRVELPPLSLAHTEALLESVFARAANTALLAPRAHDLSAGNPREVMAFAEHLVQRGLAHYAAGSWTMPSRLDDHDLPESIELALAARIHGLPPNALELAEALSLTDPRELSLPDYVLLCEGEDHARAFGSLDALVAAGMLLPEGDRYRFSHGGWQALLAARLSAERSRELHARIAGALAGRLSAITIARHRMESGQGREAIDALLARRRAIGAHYTDELVSLLERAADVAERLEVARAKRLELQIWLLEASASLGRREAFVRFAGATLEALEAATGLTALRTLGAGLPPNEALGRALQAAQWAYEAAPENERTFPPDRAIARLARVSFAFVGMASSALDLPLIERLPSLSPLTALAPQLALVEMTVEACKHDLTGRFAVSREVYRNILARLDGPELAGMGQDGRERARLGATYALGLFEAAHGTPVALEHASTLEQHTGYRVNAWRLRMVYYALLGDLDEARRCERRAQLLLLQDGARPFPATDLHAEAGARFLSDDLDGLRQMLEHLQEATQRFPAREVTRRLAHCHYVRLKGDPGGALEGLNQLLAQLSPEKSERFVWYGATHVMLLNALGRHAEAAANGRRYLAVLYARGLVMSDCVAIIRPLCEALAYNGEAGEAEVLAEALIERFEQLGSQGLVLGSCYEARARVAIAIRDARGVERWIARCQTEYDRARSPVLARKLAHLTRDAQLAQLAHTAAPLGPSEPDTLEETHTAALARDDGTVLSRMADCIDDRERFRCALTLLIEETRASSGHLYGWLSGRLTHLAAVPAAPPPTGIDADLQHFVEAELRASEITAKGGASEPSPPSVRDLATGPLQPVLLCADRDGEPTVAAVALLGFGGSTWRKPSRQLLSKLAQALLDHDDVDAQVRLG